MQTPHFILTIGLFPFFSIIIITTPLLIPSPFSLRLELSSRLFLFLNCVPPPLPLFNSPTRRILSSVVSALSHVEERRRRRLPPRRGSFVPSRYLSTEDRVLTLSFPKGRHHHGFAFLMPQRSDSPTPQIQLAGTLFVPSPNPTFLPPFETKPDRPNIHHIIVGGLFFYSPQRYPPVELLSQTQTRPSPLRFIIANPSRALSPSVPPSLPLGKYW